jgi:predicted permease
MLESLLGDLRLAARGLRRSPGFTLVAVLTLGLGSGATAAVFTVLDAALLRGLPYRDPDRLVHVWETTPERSDRQVSHPDFADVRDAARSFENVGGYAFDGFSLAGSEGLERVAAARVSAGFFGLLGVEPILGRSFRPEEDQPLRKRDVVLLSHGLWLRRFGGDPAIVGGTLTLSGEPYTVLGVLPPGFHFARLGDPELFVTLSPNQAAVERRYMHWMWAVARLRPGAGIGEANAELAAIARDREREDPRWHAATGLRAEPLRDAIVGGIRPLLLGLLASVAAVLLIACVNVANMLLARAAGRRREVGVRVALGAGRARLVRQFLVESLLLALLGGGAGLLWAGWGVRAMVAAIPDAQRQALPFFKDLNVHPGIWTATFLVCVLTGVVFGLAPALHAHEGGLARSLREGRRSTDQRSLQRRLLVVGEVGLALALLAAAGLLTRSLHRLLRVDPGFDSRGVMTARLSLPADAYDTPQRIHAFHGAFQQKLAALPEVAGVALVDRLPLLGSGNTGTPSVVGRPASDTSAADSELRTVSSGYFRVMGIPLRAGRGFTESDGPGAPRVVVVNEAFVRHVLGGEDAIGRHVSFVFMDGQPLEIIGVVANENVSDLDARAARPVLYFPSPQDPSSSTNLVVRARGEPRTLAAALRRELRALEPRAVLSVERTLDDLIAGSRPAFLRRYPLLLLGWFAALALVLAAVGVYGVMACAVSQRTGEIGVRMALGARPRDVLALVLREGVTLALAGVAVGVLLALAGGRAIASLLFETRPWDPVVLGAAALVLTAAAAAACWVPALRAARVDPLAAIRCE